MSRSLFFQSSFCLLSVCLAAVAGLAEDPSGAKGKLLLNDSFDRQEKDDTKEEVGNGWATNSKSRAKGEKQVDLKDGAMYIYRADVADHGVSVVHDLKFKDALIRLRFKLGDKDSLGINIADMKEKSVHAGHICLALIKRNKLEIADLKTGRMAKDRRERRLAKKQTDEDKKLLKQKSKYFPIDLAADTWHQLQVQIAGDEMTVSINDKKIGSFRSAGIGHETKSRIRLAVAKNAWVDDVQVYRQ